MNILKQYTTIEGYQILDTLSDAKGNYRQLYYAKDSQGEKYVLTVYDVELTPYSLKDEVNGVVSINEFELYSKLNNTTTIPRFCHKGLIQIDGKNIAWLCSKYCEGVPLSYYLQSNGHIEVKQAVEMMLDVLITIYEISSITKGGGHFNLSPENILVEKYDTANPYLVLIGWSHISEQCYGRPPFDPKESDPLYLAPEAFLGLLTQQSDIYSLGVILAYMITGQYPWDTSNLDLNDKMSLPTKIKAMVKEPMNLLGVEESLQEIIGRATAKSIEKRCHSAKELLFWLESFLEIGEVPLEKEMNTFINNENKQDNNDQNNNVKIENETIGKSSSTITIDKISGNGYADVAGMESLKAVFRRNFIDIVKNIEMAKEYQITPPNSSLLYGPPGAGKTFIVQKTAEEAGLNYTMVKPSDISSIYIHGSQSMIADVFKKAEKMAPVLLCFDEFDAMVPSRTIDDNSNMGGEVNEFLAQLNNCAERGIYVMGTTNRPDRIDKAILRKGRFDELIYVPLPDYEARKSMFEIELNKRPHNDTIDYEQLASLTENYASSDISYIVKEAARVSFEKSIHTTPMTIQPIDESILETIISQTKPSVSKADLRRYEQMEKEMSLKNDESRQRIGFNR